MPSSHVTITANIAKRIIGIKIDKESLVFASSKYGYETAPAAQTVTITNTRNQPTGVITVSVSDPDKFEVSQSTPNSLAALNDTASFTVQPKNALPVGAHSATVTVKVAETEAVYLDVKFTVEENELTEDLTGTATITGDPVYGEILAADVSSNADENHHKYQWKTDDVKIAGAESKTYELAGGDIGKQISVEITAAESGFIRSISSLKTNAVAKRPISAAITAVSKEYDGNTDAALTVALESGRLINGDAVAATASGAFDDANAGNGKAVAVSNFSASGEGADYYEYVYPSSVAGEITKKPIVITASNHEINYGDPIPPLKYTIAPGQLIGGETAEVLNINLSTDAVRSSNAGAYPITGTGSADNYSISVTPGVLTVNKIAYPGGNIILNKTVKSGVFAADVIIQLPPLPLGASYASVSVKEDEGIPELVENPRVSGNTLTFDVTAQADESRAQIILPIENATNYLPFDVVVNITAAETLQEAKPFPGVDFRNEKLNSLFPNSVYVFNGVSIATDASGEISIDDGWFGNNLTIIKSGSVDSGTTDSEENVLAISARPAAPAPGKTDATNSAGGSITGVSDSMEYKLNAAANWISIYGTSVAGLDAGTYFVRYKATESAFAGASATVTVESPVTTETGNTGGGSSVTSGSSGTGSASTTGVGANAPDTSEPDPPRETITASEDYEEEAAKGDFNITVQGTVNGVTMDFVMNNDGSVSLALSADEITAFASAGAVSIIVKNQPNVVVGLSIPALGGVSLSLTTDAGTVTLSPDALESHRAKHGETLTLSIKKGSVVVELLDSNGNPVDYNDPANPLLVRVPVLLAMDTSTFGYIAVRKDSFGQTVIPHCIYDNESGELAFITPSTGEYEVVYRGRRFADMPHHWATPRVTFAAARRLVEGIGDNQFAPDEPMTRAMFARLIANVESADLSLFDISRFADVDSNEWYSPAIAWASSVGIVDGNGDGTFGPNDLINREQMAAMLANYFNYKNFSLPNIPTGDFADENDIAEWALDAVRLIQKAGIVGGKPGNLFDPQGSATRAEAAAILANFIDVYVRNAHESLPAATTRPIASSASPLTNSKIVLSDERTAIKIFEESFTES